MPRSVKCAIVGRKLRVLTPSPQQQAKKDPVAATAARRTPSPQQQQRRTPSPQQQQRRTPSPQQQRRTPSPQQQQKDPVAATAAKKDPVAATAAKRRTPSPQQQQRPNDEFDIVRCGRRSARNPNPYTLGDLVFLAVKVRVRPDGPARTRRTQF